MWNVLSQICSTVFKDRMIKGNVSSVAKKYVSNVVIISTNMRIALKDFHAIVNIETFNT